MYELPLNRLPREVTRLFLAFSGGVDSRVLLELLLTQARAYSIELWHINYGLQDNAESMESLARRLAGLHQLPLRVDRVDLGGEKQNIEARAREARYGLFESRLDASCALVTAHQMNDQAETLLLNLMRGSSARGLRSMSMLRKLGRGWLFRPLLELPRPQIDQLARQWQLEWVEDPTNQTQDQDRNFLRHNIVSQLQQRWPKAVASLYQASIWQQEQFHLLGDLATQDLEGVVVRDAWSGCSCLNIDTLNRMTIERRKNLLRFWLDALSQAPPGQRQLEQLIYQLEHAADRQAIFQLADFQLRFFAGQLYWVEGEQALPAADIYRADDRCGGFKVAELSLQCSREQVLAALDSEDRGQEITLRFRLNPSSVPAAQKHRLKRMFQQQQVPTWLRATTPLVFFNDQLAGLLPPRAEIYSSGL